MFSTLRIFEAVSPGALWFFSGGLAIGLTGVLNLLNSSYGRVAAGLRRTCIGVNVVMLMFALMTGIVTGASVAEFVLVLGFLGGAGLLASFQVAQGPSMPR
jgi:hypothetical protein